MLRTTHRLANGLLQVNRAGFAQPITLFNQNSPSLHRVMSTPTWPVPYYQRLTKAYPIFEEKKANLFCWDLEADECTWYAAKKALMDYDIGRFAVQIVENNSDITSYLTVSNNCDKMIKILVEDMSMFLDISNKEATKILKDKTLI